MRVVMMIDGGEAKHRVGESVGCVVRPTALCTWHETPCRDATSQTARNTRVAPPGTSHKAPKASLTTWELSRTHIARLSMILS
jgi:hypothetical protein